MAAKQTDLVLAGERLSIHYAVPSTAATVVVCVHGGPGGSFEGPAGLFRDLLDRLPGRGVGVVTYSSRGSGDSEMDRLPTFEDGVEDFARVLAWAVGEFRREVVVIAESMGVTMALGEVWRLNSAGVGRIALLWPALNLFDTDLRDFLVPEAVRPARQSGWLELGDGGAVVSASFVESCLTVDRGEALKRFLGTAVILHGTSDQEVPFTHAQRAASILGERAELELVPGADHGLKRPSERELVLDRLSQFLGAATEY